mmetsp:Transcript_31573/g.89661  ORF Transcript_31573/g.89661 Transcript_31573/m.89661 type:complete len:81 (+) Transcript_31573:375-617(+)
MSCASISADFRQQLEIQLQQLAASQADVGQGAVVGGTVRPITGPTVPSGTSAPPTAATHPPMPSSHVDKDRQLAALSFLQ